MLPEMSLSGDLTRKHHDRRRWSPSGSGRVGARAKASRCSMPRRLQRPVLTAVPCDSRRRLRHCSATTPEGPRARRRWGHRPSDSPPIPAWHAAARPTGGLGAHGLRSAVTARHGLGADGDSSAGPDGNSCTTRLPTQLKQHLSRQGSDEEPRGIHDLAGGVQQRAHTHAVMELVANGRERGWSGEKQVAAISSERGWSGGGSSPAHCCCALLL